MSKVFFDIKLSLAILIIFITIFSLIPITANAEQSITITECPKNKNDYFDAGYLLINIQLDDIHDLRTYQGSGTFSELVEAAQSQEDGEIICAINGDFWNYLAFERVIVRNGEVLSELEYISRRDYCVIAEDGTMRTYPASIEDPNDLVKCWQLFCFGPELVHNYKPVLDYSNCFDYDVAWNSHPRTAIGYYEKNHFCFLLVYGRNEKDHGCYLEEMAQFFADLGCKYAYNLDGGSSSHVWYDGKEQGKPNEDKPLSDIIYIRRDSQ